MPLSRGSQPSSSSGSVIDLQPVLSGQAQISQLLQSILQLVQSNNQPSQKQSYVDYLESLNPDYLVRLKNGDDPIALNRSYNNPFPYTLVVRGTVQQNNFAAPFFQFSSSQNFDNSRFDRQLYFHESGSLKFFNLPNQVVDVTSPQTYNDGKMHTFVGRADSNESAIFVDGVHVASSSSVGAYNQAGYWKINYGFRGDLNQPSYAANSFIETAAIFNGISLTNAQIAKIQDFL